MIVDLLDLGLDVFSAYLVLPLSRSGAASSDFTLIEAILPGTQFLPTMTAAWMLARRFPWLGGSGSGQGGGDVIDVSVAPAHDSR